MSITIVAWLGAVLIGISLGLFGSGGSIVTVPVLIYLFGQDEKTAIAGSLFIVGAIALAGALPKLVSRQIDWRSVLMFGVPGMVGTYLGAWSAKWIPGLVQLAAFAVVMLLAATLMLRPRPVDPLAVPVPRHAWKIAIDGVAVGALTGLVGVGGGFLIVPALVLLGGLSIHLAIGTSLLIIAMKSFAGFWKYLEVLAHQGLALDWPVLLGVTAVGVAGSLLGNLLANRIRAERLRSGFAIFLLLMGAYILISSLYRLMT